MRHLWLSTSVAIVLCAGSAFGQFANIVDNKSIFSGYSFVTIDPFPGINDAGQVVFTAEYDDGGSIKEGVFLADTAAPGIPITKLVDNTGAYDSFSLGVSFINNSGTSAVTALRDDGEREIFTVTPGGAVTPIVDTSTAAFATLQSPPGIDGAGNVVFRGSNDAGDTAVYSANGGTPLNTATTIESSTSGTHSNFFFAWANEPGDVLFFAGGGPSNPQLLLERTGGGRDTVATVNTTSGPLTQALPYQVNDHGDVSYVGRDFATGERFIAVWDESTGIPTTYVSESDGLDLSPGVDPALNANGLLVFSRNAGSPSFGPIYYSFGTAFDVLIESGDPLFGGTTLGAISGFALNNSDQAAFFYVLDDESSPGAEDNTFGLAIVQVPEPASASLLLWLCGAAMVWRRCHHRVTRFQEPVPLDSR
jgi:hypothetical protein